MPPLKLIGTRAHYALCYQPSMLDHLLINNINLGIDLCKR